MDRRIYLAGRATMSSAESGFSAYVALVRCRQARVYCLVYVHCPVICTVLIYKAIHVELEKKKCRDHAMWRSNEQQM
jgi:hypothetical protein